MLCSVDKLLGRRFIPTHWLRVQNSMQLKQPAFEGSVAEPKLHHFGGDGATMGCGSCFTPDANKNVTSLLLPFV
jgi:hypothetical protein